MPKILILRFSSIGDIVLTTPVVRCIKKQVAEAQVHFLTKEAYRNVMEANPYIDKLISFNKSNLHEVIKQLKAEDYDLVIDLHNNLRSLRIKSALRKKSASFHKLNLQKWLLVNFRYNKMPDLHIVDRYMEPAHRLLGVANDGLGLDYFVPKQDGVLPADIDPRLQNKYLAFVIGAQHNTKKLTTEKAVSLCEVLPPYPVVLIGGPDDRQQAKAIMEQTKNPLLINTCGSLQLNQSASLVAQAEVVMTHDTGLMHIAAAFKKKIISIWGNTVPALGMFPYKAHPDSTIFEIPNLPCRPCSKIGYAKCPKNHFNCISLLDEEAIARRSEILFTT